MLNTGHIFIPDSHFEIKHWKRIDEEKHPSRVWKRPWLKPPKTRGRVLEVVNQAVVTMKGFKHWTPLQAALMALPEAKEKGFDQVRVKSPARYGRRALKATADKVYDVTDLVQMARGTILAPKVGRRTVRVEDQGEGSALSGRWSLTEQGILCPAF